VPKEKWKGKKGCELFVVKGRKVEEKGRLIARPFLKKRRKTARR
jgi:hypothetical protein